MVLKDFVLHLRVLQHMIYIGDLLNKIRWDEKVKPDEYTLVYFDRVAEKGFEVKFTAISREGNFFVVIRDGHKTMIPLHRIRQVKRQGKVIWESM
jgi:uncharacterized protein (UPF0248 family)